MVATICAKSYCDLYVLKKTTLDKTLKNFPAERERIEQIVKEYIEKDKLREVLRQDLLFSDVNQAELSKFVEELHRSFTVNPSRYCLLASNFLNSPTLGEGEKKISRVIAMQMSSSTRSMKMRIRFILWARIHRFSS